MDATHSQKDCGQKLAENDARFCVLTCTFSKQETQAVVHHEPWRAQSNNRRAYPGSQRKGTLYVIFRIEKIQKNAIKQNNYVFTLLRSSDRKA